MTLTISASAREACLVPSHCVRVQQTFSHYHHYWLGLHRDSLRALFLSLISLSPSLPQSVTLSLCLFTLISLFYGLSSLSLVALNVTHYNSPSLSYTFIHSISHIHPSPYSLRLFHALALDRISAALYVCRTPASTFALCPGGHFSILVCTSSAINESFSRCLSSNNDG